MLTTRVSIISSVLGPASPLSGWHEFASLLDTVMHAYNTRALSNGVGQDISGWCLFAYLCPGLLVSFSEGTLVL